MYKMETISYSPDTATEAQTQEWTDMMTERVWDHVDPETGGYDLSEYVEHCQQDGLNPTLDQAERYLQYARECVIGE